MDDRLEVFPLLAPTPKPYLRMDEDPIDVQFVANLADALDYNIDRQPERRAASKIEIPQRHPRDYSVEAWGNEAIRITEVMARPVMPRLQPKRRTSHTRGWR